VKPAYPSQSHSFVNAGEAEAGRHRRRSSTPLELDACSRSNIVTARTRFFEEKTRSAAAKPQHRRSRSATPQFARDFDDQGHSRSNLGLSFSRQLHTTQDVTPPTSALSCHGRLVPALTTLFASAAPVNNETDELKVFDYLQ